MSQLRSDYAATFESAKDRIRRHALGSGDLLETIRPFILGLMRFIEPNRSIRNPQANLAAKVEAFERMPQPQNYMDAKQGSRARHGALAALFELRVAIFNYGQASAADQMGLGVQGKRI